MARAKDFYPLIEDWAVTNDPDRVPLNKAPDLAIGTVHAFTYDAETTQAGAEALLYAETGTLWTQGDIANIVYDTGNQAESLLYVGETQTVAGVTVAADFTHISGALQGLTAVMAGNGVQFGDGETEPQDAAVGHPDINISLLDADGNVQNGNTARPGLRIQTMTEAEYDDLVTAMTVDAGTLYLLT